MTVANLRVSVIIPTFNRLHTLERALTSVMQQRYAPLEIIVIDDGSTDGTANWIRTHYPAISLIEQAQQGVSAARNTGIHSARGDWIALLDSDDVWHPEKLHKQVAALSALEKQQPPDSDRAQQPVALCHTEEIWIRHGKRVNPMKKHAKRGGHIFEHCLPLCAISPSSSLIRKSVLDAIGLFDESLPACEDYDLWLRICSRYPVLFIDEPLITKYGGHEDQLSRRFWGMDRFRVKALQKILDEETLDPDYRQAATDMLDQKCRILLQGAIKHGNQEMQTFCKQVMQQFKLPLPEMSEC